MAGTDSAREPHSYETEAIRERDDRNAGHLGSLAGPVVNILSITLRISEHKSCLERGILSTFVASQQQQLGFENRPFETSRAPNPIFCHQEFLEKLAALGRDPVARRAAFLLQRLSVDIRRLHYKSVRGPNQGWRRSRLGGNHDSHFYAWWAPKNAAPLNGSGGFADTPDGSIFVRDIRHHDDHSELAAHGVASHYLPITVHELRREEYGPSPWTQQQTRFAAARTPVRLLKGHPGSGKTTALWHAADSAGKERILYVTYSADLAALARQYFDRFCSSHKKFEVITFPNLVRSVAGEDVPYITELESRRRFSRDLAPLSRTLGAWSDSNSALYDELHAHLIGDALPIAVGRFVACRTLRVPDKAYRERRTRYLGNAAVTSALETAARLERLSADSFAERYCPELALARRAVENLLARKVADRSLFDFDCIAVDECQDLTPIEALLIAELGALKRATVLLAGDEAQTVRPTDFEWGWLSDLLHARAGTPSTYQLSANLRSPRRIAELVNRAWDLYSHLEKQERPSGAGYAEIDDDASDQVLYCAAAPGVELHELLKMLASREGLAMISLGDAVPEYVPAETRDAVLTASEAKGLDFHSVCILDAGKQIERILREQGYLRSAIDVETLRKRLAIDQLRVSLSRPTERLLWLDVNPSDSVVRHSLGFLNGSADQNRISSCVPEALMKALEEDDLDVQERILRCQQDARQYLSVRPEMAWSRAQQAVTLLGRPGTVGAVEDQAARDAAQLGLAEICFALGIRNARLAPELGRPDAFIEAKNAAAQARRPGLATLIEMVGQVHRATPENRLQPLVRMAQALPEHKSEIEPWLEVEMSARSKDWVEELETAVFNGHNASILVKILPPFYEALGLADGAARSARLRQRAVQLFLKEKQFAAALSELKNIPERQPKLEAACHQGLGDYQTAAACYLLAGDREEALRCYRMAPDLAAALRLAGEMGGHPALESLEWIAKLQKLVAERPEKFSKVVTAEEKKALETLLEQALGVRRPRRLVKKAAPKKSVVPRKRRPTE